MRAPACSNPNIVPAHLACRWCDSLVKDEAKCESIKEDLVAGRVTFDAAAREFSTCPSGKKGGSLGKFGPGQVRV